MMQNYDSDPSSQKIPKKFVSPKIFEFDTAYVKRYKNIALNLQFM